MKRFRVVSLLILAGLCAAGMAKAQIGAIRANVPFDFTVGNKSLPSGNYQFLMDSARSSHMIFIRSADQQMIVLSMTGDRGNLPGDATRLVFYKYGDHYFLREIHCPAVALNAALPQSKREKQTRQQMASLGPEQVLLALK